MSLLRNIQAVTFDVGGTLIEPWPSVGDIYSEVAARHGLEVSPHALNHQFHAAWRARKNFGYTMTAWSSLVDEAFSGLTPAPPSGSFFPELYQRFAAADAWRIFDDVIPALQALKKQALKVGAISNWDERLRPLMSALGLSPYLEVTVISSEVGVPKPHSRMFAEASSQLAIPPEAILHVGDSLREDLEGARAAGFKSRLLNRQRSGAGGLEIASLLDLVAPDGN